MKTSDSESEIPDLTSPEVTARIVERIRRMTPEELRAFLDYRTPGIEETDMIGVLSDPADPDRTAQTA